MPGRPDVEAAHGRACEYFPRHAPQMRGVEGIRTKGCHHRYLNRPPQPPLPSEEVLILRYGRRAHRDPALDTSRPNEYISRIFGIDVLFRASKRKARENEVPSIPLELNLKSIAML